MRQRSLIRVAGKRVVQPPGATDVASAHAVAGAHAGGPARAAALFAQPKVVEGRRPFSLGNDGVQHDGRGGHAGGVGAQRNGLPVDPHSGPGVVRETHINRVPRVLCKRQRRLRGASARRNPPVPTPDGDVPVHTSLWVVQRNGYVRCLVRRTLLHAKAEVSCRQLCGP